MEFVFLYEPVNYRVLRRTGLQDADALEVLQDLLLAVSRNIERWENLEQSEPRQMNGISRERVLALRIKFAQGQARCHLS